MSWVRRRMKSEVILLSWEARLTPWGNKIYMYAYSIIWSNYIVLLTTKICIKRLVKNNSKYNKGWSSREKHRSGEVAQSYRALSQHVECWAVERPQLALHKCDGSWTMFQAHQGWQNPLMHIIPGMVRDQARHENQSKTGVMNKKYKQICWHMATLWTWISTTCLHLLHLTWKIQENIRCSTYMICN